MSKHNILSLITIRTLSLVFPINAIVSCKRLVIQQVHRKKHLRPLFEYQIMGCRTSKVEITKKQPPSSSSSTKVSSNGPPKDDEYVESIVCCETDIQENEMKVFEIQDEGKVLLVKQKGKIHALGTKCPHYGAPLVGGALGDGRLRCQWHGACFNINTGDIEDFPGLDSLPCYQVTIENCQVKVRAKKSLLDTQKRTKPMSKKLSSNMEHYVVIGGGPAGAVCAETLRQENFEGTITMVCKEKHLPYDRVKVSKMGYFELDKNLLRSAEFYKEHEIDVLLGVAAAKVDTKSKQVYLENGESLKYDKLFVATGSTPAVLDVPGKDLKNIITLRNYEDGKNLISTINRESNLVILGNSFIGMEAAACCADKVKSVTVVSRTEFPFQNSLGEEIGRAVFTLFESKGVHFHSGASLQEIRDNGSGEVGSVELNDGTVLEADVLVLGIGSTFNTDFLKGSGVEIRDNGSIDVDEHLKTNVPEVFVGGDIAHAPVYSHHNQKATIGHFPLAHYHGKMAALNMLDKNERLKVVPFFWTMLFGKGFRYAGHGRFKEIIYAGNVEELKFVAFYLDENEEVVAACSSGMDPVVSQFAELMQQGRKLHKKDLEEEPLAWVSTVAPAVCV